MKRILFIGQAPARPGSRHSQPGTYLRPWLERIGLDAAAIDTHCRFYALTDTFPGAGRSGHLRPTPQQLAEHRPELIANIQAFAPQIIVPVGTMAIAEILPGTAKALRDLVGKPYAANPFGCLGKPITTIPLPHPSGRSTWLRQNQVLLDQALDLLASSITK